MKLVYMSVYIYIYIYINTHTYVHTNTHTHIVSSLIILLNLFKLGLSTLHYTEN